jgi:SAM-dependent methyltransferase
MTQWYFWGDKQLADVYENIYIRTFVEDWFDIVLSSAKEIKGGLILDVGCGEGHTTKQVLDRVKGNVKCDLLEPNKGALKLAKKFLSFENNVGDVFEENLSGLNTEKKYDSIFTSHTNYYWADDRKSYDKQLDKLMSLLNKNGNVLILTLPRNSDHYNIMVEEVYPDFVFGEYIVDYYRKKGFRVDVKKFKMRMFVGDILTNKHFFDLNNFYRFIHNQDYMPNESQAKEFLQKIKKFEKKGYLDFKDELIIISRG